jgi:ABC-type antimicrobial peptide transport system permease subunit
MLVFAGLVIGIACALLGTRAMRAWLFETAPADPLTIALVPLVFAVCCLISCVVPLRRSTTVDPVVALRAE